MPVDAIPTRFLTNRFQSFYALLRRLGDQVCTPGIPGEDAVSRAKVEETVGALADHLARGKGEAYRLGGDYGAALYKDAAYAMAALADEMFLLEFDWGGQSIWDDTLVETQVFGSRLAGERLFARMDEVLGNNEPAHAELAGLFLMVLALGFQGRCRGVSGGAEELASYRRRLRVLAGNEMPSLVPGEGDGPLFANAYDSTCSDAVAVGLPPLRPWLWGAAALVAVYVLVSHMAWTHLTGPVRAIIAAGDPGLGG